MRKVVLFFLRLYRSVSGVFPGRCIYFPTCSQYSQQAFLHYPFFKALKLSLIRLLRCNPFAKGGIDLLK
ncbi:MAG: membrane protein insertion efficiency factor YidD [Candidatus Omnitrophota bacterium]